MDATDHPFTKKKLCHPVWHESFHSKLFSWVGPLIQFVRSLLFPLSAYQVYVTLKSRILFCIFVLSRAFLGATKNCHDLQIQFSSSVISQKSKVHQEASKDLYIKGRKALAQCVTVVTWKLHKLCHHPEGQ